MKKAVTLFFAMLTLAASTGLTFALHYCGQSLEDVAVFGKAMPCCEGMEMPAGCCHEEQIQVASDDYQPTSIVAQAGFVPVLICVVGIPEFDFQAQFRNSTSHFTAPSEQIHPPAADDVVVRTHAFLI